MIQPDELNRFDIPAWNRKRRLKMAFWMSVFIGLCSLSIGAGIFQIKAGRDMKYQSVNKETILELLAQDTEFFRTISKQAKLRTCRNETHKFELVHDTSLKPAGSGGELACMQFTGTHPTGRQIEIRLTVDNRSREKTMLEEAKHFSYAETDLLASEYRPVSRIKGLLNGVPTTYYVADFLTGSIQVAYSPTSPTLDNEVEELALSIIPLN